MSVCLLHLTYNVSTALSAMGYLVGNHEGHVSSTLGNDNFWAICTVHCTPGLPKQQNSEDTINLLHVPWL